MDDSGIKRENIYKIPGPGGGTQRSFSERSSPPVPVWRGHHSVCPACLLALELEAPRPKGLDCSCLGPNALALLRPS